MMAAKQVRAHISAINLLEVLVRPLREGQSELTSTYDGLLTDANAVALHPVTIAVAERAAAIRATYGTEVADAIVAATALEAGCDYLIINNGDDFKRIEELKVLLINDYI